MPDRKKPKKNFERSWRILEYLKRNSDLDHPVSRAELLKDPTMKKYVDGKDTFKDAIFNMAHVLNSGENESTLPQDQWKIFYQAYSDIYGDGSNGRELENEEEEDEEDETDEKKKAPGRQKGR